LQLDRVFPTTQSVCVFWQQSRQTQLRATPAVNGGRPFEQTLFGATEGSLAPLTAGLLLTGNRAVGVVANTTGHPNESI